MKMMAAFVQVRRAIAEVRAWEVSAADTGITPAERESRNAAAAEAQKRFYHAVAALGEAVLQAYEERHHHDEIGPVGSPDGAPAA